MDSGVHKTAVGPGSMSSGFPSDSIAIDGSGLPIQFNSRPLPEGVTPSGCAAEWVSLRILRPKGERMAGVNDSDAVSGLRTVGQVVS